MGAVSLYHVTGGETGKIRMIIRLSLGINHNLRLFFHPGVAYDLRRRSFLLILRLLLDLFNMRMSRTNRSEIILHLSFTGSRTRRCRSCRCSYRYLPPCLIDTTTLHRQSGTVLTASLLSLSVVPTITLFRASIVI